MIGDFVVNTGLIWVAVTSECSLLLHSIQPHHADAISKGGAPEQGVFVQ